MWRERLGSSNAVCTKGKRGRRNFVEFSVEGSQLDPGDGERETEFLLTSRLLANAGLALSYSYSNGANRLTLTPPKKLRIGQLGQLFIAAAAAILCGFACTELSQDMQNNILAVSKPFFDMMFGALRAVCSPLIFLAICSSVSDFGDISLLERVGSKILGRFIIAAFITAAAAVCIFVPFFSSGSGTHSSNTDYTSVYKMILDIVPSDIITPFQTGNALQIIFLASVLGIVLLVLGDRVSPVKMAVFLLDEIVNYITLLISRFMPLFVFLSIFNIFLSHISAGTGSFVKLLLFGILGSYFLLLLLVFAASIYFKVGPFLLIKKLLPVHLIVLSTASTVASFAVNLDISERCLGIPKKIVNFAVPIGQVLFRPGIIIEYSAIAVFLSGFYGVEATPLWITKAILISALLSIATPPIAGAGLMVFSILFAQLSIPAEAIAIAAVADAVMDFPTTACSVSCMQLGLLFETDSAGMLDKDSLRRQLD